jgi:hypothetical protein
MTPRQLLWSLTWSEINGLMKNLSGSQAGTTASSDENMLFADRKKELFKNTKHSKWNITGQVPKTKDLTAFTRGLLGGGY